LAEDEEIQEGRHVMAVKYFLILVTTILFFTLTGGIPGQEPSPRVKAISMPVKEEASRTYEKGSGLRDAWDELSNAPYQGDGDLLVSRNEAPSHLNRVRSDFPDSAVVPSKYDKANILISNVNLPRSPSKTAHEAQAEETAGASGRTYPFVIPKYIFITLLVSMAFILIPFLPGIIELFRPKDDRPLALNMNFSKDYKFFGKSFKKIIENGLGMEHVLEPGEYTLVLSKPEKVRVVEWEKVSEKKTVDEILFVLVDFASGSDAQFKKEIYVKGACMIGDRNTLRALYCEGDLVIGERTSVVRWVDGDKDIDIKEGCQLGMSVACSRKLSVARNCSFSRMFGLPIATYRVKLPEIPPDIQVRDISDTTIMITKEETIIPPHTSIPRDIVTRQRIVLKERTLAKANIKSYRDIIIEKGSRVEGNLFSEKSVIIEAGCTILGNIFSQGRVKLGNAVQVGQEGQIKSVIAKKGIFIEGNVNIYGYLMTEGEGKIL
jgi:predicted acyltransferase (DUF342 family)